MKPITTVTAAMLGVVAVAHALRLLLGVPVTIGTFAVPAWVSVVGTLLPVGLAFGLWREGTRSSV